MGGHTEYGECLSIGQVIALLVETEKKCQGEYGLHFEAMEVKWKNEQKRFLVKIRYSK